MNPHENPWRQVSTREVYKNPWLRVREDSVIRPDGSSGIYGVIELADFAAVVAINEHGQIALVKQWRYLYGSLSLELPAGNAQDNSESPLAAAQRELEEETGLRARTWKSLGQIRYSAVKNTGHLYLATDIYEHNAEPTRLDQDDWTELVWTDYFDVIDLLKSNVILEATAVAGISKAEILRSAGEWIL